MKLIVENLTVLRLIKKFFAFYGKRNFIALFTMSLNPNAYLQLRSVVSYTSADKTTDWRTTTFRQSIADDSTWDTPHLAQ